jgi:predicted NAD/FAD-dependent oxidoreductase
VKRPSWVQPHRWRFARSDPGSALRRPLALRVGALARVILTGESFAPGGGIESAWLAGNASARRLLEEE